MIALPLPTRSVRSPFGPRSCLLPDSTGSSPLGFDGRTPWRASHRITPRATRSSQRQRHIGSRYGCRRVPIALRRNESAGDLVKPGRLLTLHAASLPYDAECIQISASLPPPRNRSARPAPVMTLGGVKRPTARARWRNLAGLRRVGLRDQREKPCNGHNRQFCGEAVVAVWLVPMLTTADSGRSLMVRP